MSGLSSLKTACPEKAAIYHHTSRQVTPNMFASTLTSVPLLCAAGALAQTLAGTTPSTGKNPGAR
ncbi:hypothetical protein GGTG_05838 [Gaeumannomyces tritici R3-111a-1]|uniref:Uncharacterized protein n=1 Tax=Gaeumannomyces tritici (strain R3-111a-1) TaxID=644352 RepID=J3NX31_GAET3|nr:hypothetical protein GGTG_05838 [Gaeumannomyces tritici R3-111a-1]EJT75913.1 hypothetical protein GGTG_05838 [Gaeumannomyces tritici R3-111a-1]